MLHKVFIILFLILFSATGVMKAQTVSLENILATGVNDEKVMRDIDLEKFSKTLKYNLPAIKKIDIRLGVNGNNTPDTLDGSLRNEDYYSLTLTTNKWKEMQLQKQIKPVQTNMITKEKEMFEMQALQDRFTVIANLYYSLESAKRKKELQELLNKKNELLQQLLSEGVPIKINDALDTEKDLILALGMIQDEENNLAINYAKLRQFFNSQQAVSINFDGMISLKRILENNTMLRMDTSNIHPSLFYKEAQYQLAHANYKLERIQNMNFMNTFQVGYNRPVYTNEILKKFKPENTLTFRVGLSIPIVGNYNLNRSNANMQQYNALLNWQSARITQGKLITIQESRLDNSIRQYNALLDIYTKSVVAKLLQNEKIMAQSTPLEIMDMKIARKKIEINLLLCESTLMQNYIQLLESKGLLLYNLRHKYLFEN